MLPKLDLCFYVFLCGSQKTCFWPPTGFCHFGMMHHIFIHLSTSNKRCDLIAKPALIRWDQIIVEVSTTRFPHMHIWSTPISPPDWSCCLSVASQLTRIQYKVFRILIICFCTWAQLWISIRASRNSVNLRALTKVNEEQGKRCYWWNERMEFKAGQLRN